MPHTASGSARLFHVLLARHASSRFCMSSSAHLTGASGKGSLSAAYEIVAAMHNALDLTPPLDTAVSPYYGRPYLTLYARRFAEALVTAINDPAMRGIIDTRGIDWRRRSGRRQRRSAHRCASVHSTAGALRGLTLLTGNLCALTCHT